MHGGLQIDWQCQCCHQEQFPHDEDERAADTADIIHVGNAGAMVDAFIEMK